MKLRMVDPYDRRRELFICLSNSSIKYTTDTSSIVFILDVFYISSFIYCYSTYWGQVREYEKRKRNVIFSSLRW